LNHRRKLLAALGAAALASPLMLHAQTKVWRVGFLAPRSRQDVLKEDPYGSFPVGMRDLGYVEGKNLTIEWRYAGGEFDKLPALAAELVQMKVDVMVTIGPQATSVAHKLTTTIPIVMVVSNDPVGSGLVASLGRPGGNITGLSNFSADLSPKHLEMLTNMVPRLARVAVLTNPTNSGQAAMLKNIEAAAQKLNSRILPVQAQTVQEIESAFVTMVRGNAGAIIVMLDPYFIQQRRQIADLAVKHRLPSISPFREYAEAGGLMSYGRNLQDQYRRMATFVDKILKGAKPGDLPVEQPTTLELIINGKTAKALGLTIPQSLLISADKVIE
jgi:putative ABC transport system substrate-binding protein